MANPQAENGHTDIANEIMEALSKTRLSGEESQCLWFILRKTYGWKKKQDKISLSQFSDMTGINRPNVVRALGKLLSKKIICVIKKDNSKANVYKFNKDYDSWCPLQKKSVIKKDNTLGVINIDKGGVIKKDNQVLSKKIHTKETITKETITNAVGENQPMKNKNDIGGKNDVRNHQQQQQNFSHEIPEDLKGLILYEKNTDLCESWNGLKKVWETCYPYLNILQEVRKAHSTQYTTGRSRDPKTYIQTWLNRASGKVNNSNWKGNGKGYKTAQEKNKQEIDCFNNLLEGDSLND